MRSTCVRVECSGTIPRHPGTSCVNARDITVNKLARTIIDFIGSPHPAWNAMFANCCVLVAATQSSCARVHYVMIVKII